MTGCALWHEIYDGRFGKDWRDEKDLIPLVIVTDSKGSYDHLTKKTTGPGEDRRTALDIAVMRDDLARGDIALRWVGTKAQLADTLSKSRGDSDMLRAVLRSGKLVIVDEPTAMEMKRQERVERQHRRGGRSKPSEEAVRGGG